MDDLAGGAPPLDPAQPSNSLSVPVPSALLGIMQRESGGQNIWNYKHALDPTGYTASGYYQITDPTWRDGGKLAGIDVSQWPSAINAPREVQDKIAAALYAARGERPWAASASRAQDSWTPPIGQGNALSTGGTPVPPGLTQLLAGNSAGSSPSSLVALQLLHLLVPAGHTLQRVDYDPFAPGMPGASKRGGTTA